MQIIKRDATKGGVLRLGTEVVSDDEGTVAALLGASPGASTAAPIMLHLIEKAFADKVATPEWKARLKEIIPSYGQKLNDSPALTNQIRAMTSQVLHLPYVEVPVPGAAPAAAPTAPATNAPAQPAPGRNANTEMQAL